MFCCTRALRLREPIDTWIRSQRGKYANPIEINHWEYMEALLPLLSCVKKTSKYLEADEYPTGSKALRKMWRLRKTLWGIYEADHPVGPGRAVMPFCRDLVTKLDELLNDPTLIWQWSFLALMDPTGGTVKGNH